MKKLKIKKFFNLKFIYNGDCWILMYVPHPKIKQYENKRNQS